MFFHFDWIFCCSVLIRVIDCGFRKLGIELCWVVSFDSEFAEKLGIEFCRFAVFMLK
ncbi:hypothetical protein RchiOBHm_Chr1g0331521 [Rosa chinensis]|uniref:Uncharacterized protein n=1 Tax=Rosa chinensis TaxID=74649 RepID=A0A2P6SBK4_ROSCH|nr:hypothetical protein RchiOBHm_Chr1g0331521 [Rosa chinensis]